MVYYNQKWTKLQKVPNFPKTLPIVWLHTRLPCLFGCQPLLTVHKVIKAILAALEFKPHY